MKAKLKFYKDISQVPQEETVFFEPTNEQILLHLELACFALELYRRARTDFKRGIKGYLSFEDFLKDKDTI